MSAHRSVPPPRARTQTDTHAHAPTLLHTHSYAANEEIDLVFRGFAHPGTMRVALCYQEESDCNKYESYEKYILGYWFTEGWDMGGTFPDYEGEVTTRVRLPNKNGRAVLQWMSDADDGRSYVSCSDLLIQGAQEEEGCFVQCNGHPYCNCTVSDSGPYGLHQSCPTTAGQGKIGELSRQQFW